MRKDRAKNHPRGHNHAPPMSFRCAAIVWEFVHQTLLLHADTINPEDYSVLRSWHDNLKRELSFAANKFDKLALLPEGMKKDELAKLRQEQLADALETGHGGTNED